MSLFKGRSKIDKSELLFSRRDLLKIIIPVFFQQILNMTVGMKRLLFARTIPPIFPKLLKCALVRIGELLCIMLLTLAEI